VKAAIVTQPNQTPTYDAFGDPAAQNGFELITVTASALFPLSKSRPAGSHYSSGHVSDGGRRRRSRHHLHRATGLLLHNSHSPR
jgi:hypothetical protein